MLLRNILLLVLMLGSRSLFSQEEMPWISNTPPEDIPGRIAPSTMHRISAERGKRGKENFLQFLRSGESVTDSPWLDSASIAAFDLQAFLPDGSSLKLDLSSRKRYGILSYDGTEEGYHYLIAKKEYSIDSVHFVDVAAAERLMHKCRNGHAHVKSSLGYVLFPELAPFEIRRERFKREDFHTFVSAGDKVKLTAFYKGMPVAGAQVRIISEEGWTLECVSDENGLIEYTMAGDYYSTLSDLDDRHRSTFLIIGELKVDEADGSVVYRYSINDDYWPSTVLYKSKTLPWILIMVFILLGTSVLILLRRRRSVSYKRIRFDES